MRPLEEHCLNVHCERHPSPTQILLSRPIRAVTRRLGLGLRKYGLVVELCSQCSVCRRNTGSVSVRISMQIIAGSTDGTTV